MVESKGEFGEGGGMKKIIKTASMISFLWATIPTIAIAQTEASITANDDVDPAKLAAANKLMDAIMPPDSRAAMMEAMIRPLMQNIQTGLQNNAELQKIFSDDAELKTIFLNFMQKQSNITLKKVQQEMPSMMTAMSRAYARQFTLQEMADAEAFYTTPSGRAFMTKGGGIMSDPDVAKWQQDMMTNMLSDKDVSLNALLDEIKAHQEKNGKKNRKSTNH
jgi:hypothetical protein